MWQPAQSLAVKFTAALARRRQPKPALPAWVIVPISGQTRDRCLHRLLIELVYIAAVIDGAQVMQVPHYQRIEPRNRRIFLHAQGEDVLDRFRRRVGLLLVDLGMV